MAEAYSGKGRSSYKYQFSVIPALHGADVSGYFSPPGGVIGPDLANAFQRLWGQFITSDNPSISSNIANGASSNSSTTNPASDWPQFSIFAPYQINLNQTGGSPFSATVLPNVNITEFRQPGLQNNITLHNAYTWEGGRGFRCDFWRSVSAIVPE